MQSWVLILSALAAASAPNPQSSPLAGFTGLLGHWKCKGAFARSGRPIAAALTMSLDRATGSILVRHDDDPPNHYHSVELWGPNGSGFKATIVDASSGVRILSSEGWRNGALEWTRFEAGQPRESFRYSSVSSRGFVLDWFIVRPDGDPVLGDTVHCSPA